MLEIHRDIIASYVGGHCDDRCLAVKLSHKVCCGYTVEVRHNDVHQHQIVLGARIELIDSFETIKLRDVSKACNGIPVLRNLPRYR